MPAVSNQLMVLISCCIARCKLLFLYILCLFRLQCEFTWHFICVFICIFIYSFILSVNINHIHYDSLHWSCSVLILVELTLSFCLFVLVFSVLFICKYGLREDFVQSSGLVTTQWFVASAYIICINIIWSTSIKCCKTT